ncbi:alpha/beta hydrolase [Mesorhizobium microcysteis]|uniref:Alpha/beta hydrolase n=1 Tax=Neoaquamicrobium microcysteis TaxID=2682781 RepID=A0A5D4GPU8_9HYPH|nr:alpha/beta hydrolase [Mesorhizobium microcysteis]TYR30194.1 alpha/beta hydrolase [Mesorhizobium microcysteis]
MQDLLFETPGNPIPANAYAGMLTMADGKRIRYARFAADARPLQGTVVILTGRNECIEKYFETIRDLSARGFGAAIFDLRGQGGSDRLLKDPHRGYINDFDDYVADIGPFFQDVVLPDCRGPYYLLAHSTGALVALMATPLLTNRVQRMVLTAPLMGFANQPLSMQNTLRLASLLNAVGLGSIYMTGRRKAGTLPAFPGNTLTTDAARFARNIDIYRHHPKLAIAGPTASWIRAACIACERVQEPDFIADLNIPTLIVAAGADRVVDTPTIERFARCLRTGSLVTIDGARHEILQEADAYREQFFAAFDAFIPGNGSV